MQVGKLDCGRDAGDRGRGGLKRCASREIAADVHRDLGLGHRLDPAGERNGSTWCDACILSEEAHERAYNVELPELRGRAKADLPAERLVAAIEALAPQRELRGHAAHDAWIVPEIH